MALISALITELRVDLADESSTRWTDASLLSMFKKAIRRANRIVQRNGIQFAKKHSTFTTVANQTYVVLSTSITDFDVLITMARSDTHQQIRICDDREWETIETADALAVAYIDYAGDKIHFYDKDSAAITINVHYYPTVDPSAYTTASSTPWSGRLDDVLMEYVGFRMKNIDEMDVSIDQQLMQDMEQQILQAYAPNAATINDTRGWL